MTHKATIIAMLTAAVLALVPCGANAAVATSSAAAGVDDFGFPKAQAVATSPADSGRGSSVTGVREHLALASTPRVSATPRPALPRAKTDNLGVFSSVAISAARLPASVNWGSVSNRDYTKLFTSECGRSGLAGCQTAFASTLRKVSSRVQGMADHKILNEVNRSVNAAMRYRTDSANWGKGDYWANPTEIARKGAGDCEDFAIAKYWLLRSLGFGPEKLQLVVLSDTRRQLYHAVLVAHVNGTAYILDNLSNQVSTDERHANYVPIMSFSGGKSYIHGFSARNSAAAALPTDMRLVNPGEGI